MVFRTSLVLVSALSLLGGTAFAADLPAGAKDALDAAYKLQCSAAMDPTDANLDASFAVLGKDYVSETFKGEKKTRDEVVSTGKQQLKQIHITKCEATIDSEEAQPDGSVIVMTTFKAEGDGQFPDGKHELSVVSRSRDIWKLVDGKWVDTYGKDLKNLVKVDGNVVQDEGN